MAKSNSSMSSTEEQINEVSSKNMYISFGGLSGV